MSEIKIPSRFEHLWADSETDFGFNVNNFEFATSVSGERIMDLIAEFSEMNPLASTDLECGDVNNFFASGIREMPTLHDDTKILLFDALEDACKSVVDHLQDNLPLTEKNNAKKLFYYLIQAAISAESAYKNKSGASMVSSNEGIKGKGAKGSKKKSNSPEVFDWPYQRRMLLLVINDIISSKLGLLWSMGIIEENFTTMIWSYCLDLLEGKPTGLSGPGSAEVSTRNLLMEIVSRSIGHFGSLANSGSYSALTTAMIDSIMKAEHMTNYCAEICRLERVHIHSNHVTTEIMNEISNMNMGLISSQGVKNISMFLEAYADADTTSFVKYIALLVKQVDSPAHQMRSAMLQSLGHIIKFIHQQLTNNANNTAPQLTTDNEESNQEKPMNMESMTRQRDSFLNMMIERTHDTNPYTRACLLKVWSFLIDAHAVPVKRIGSVSEVAVDRLSDKNSFVRRNAIVLITSIIDSNPFSGKLDRQLFEAQKKELIELIEKRLEELTEQMGEVPSELAAGLINGKKTTKPTENEDEDDDEEEEEILDEEELLNDADKDSKMVELRNKLDYVSSALELIQSIELAIPRITSLLESKNSSDVVESLTFFSRAVNFQIDGALNCFKGAFKLIWHQDQAIKNELIMSFKQIYLTTGSSYSDNNNTINMILLPPSEIALNFIRLIQSCSANELISLEQIIGEVINSISSSVDIIDSLLIKAKGSSNNMNINASEGSYSDVAAALYSVAMILAPLKATDKANTSLLTSKMYQELIQIGLIDSQENKDFLAMRSACMCIPRSGFFDLSTTKSSKKNTSKSNDDDELFSTSINGMVKMILNVFSYVGTISIGSWFGAVEEAIHTIYLIHPSPDLVVSSIITTFYDKLSQYEEAPSDILSSFLFLLGQACLNTVVYIESMANEVKKEYKKQIEAGTHPACQSEPKDIKDKNAGGVEDFEEQMGISQAIEAEHDQDIYYMIEKELIVTQLLGKFFPLVQYLSANDSGRFNDELLRQTSVLTLCRYLSISSFICEQSLSLLFTILDQEESVCIRTSILVTLGDLAFRFPNTLEPWTSHLYSRLKDQDITVRYNTLMVITHLVLNDMIKVKGQISSVALCLTDSEETIRDLAKLLFIKLSERSNNPVYNLLGDIISNFSQVNCDGQPLLSKEDFQSTMHFLLSFVQKDKQADLLFERLLIRLSMAETVYQRQYLAFCISELTITEKGMKKFIEMIKTVKMALQDDSVYESFQTLLSRAKKSRAIASANSSNAAASSSGASSTQNPENGTAPSAPMSKSVLEEAEQALLAAVSGSDEAMMSVEGAEEGSGDSSTQEISSEANQNDSASIKPTKKMIPKSAISKNGKKNTSIKSKTPKKPSKKKLSESDDENDGESDEEDYENEEEIENKPIKSNATASRTQRLTKRSRVIINDDDEEAEF